MKHSVLKLNALTMQYGEICALKNLNLELEHGIYGLLGPNGAGKSTLMNILSGLLEQTEGTVMWNGTDIRTLGKEYRSILGVVPQQQRMYEFFTGYEFLEYMAGLKGLSKQNMKSKIDWVLQQVELTKEAKRKIRTYSGGMKQRLLLAQALLNDPEILLLDEPTAGLDPRQRIVLRNLIADLGREKILIFATHVVSDIEAIAKEVLLLKEGKLIMQGTVADLCQPLEGQVVEIIVSEQQMMELKRKGKIVSFMQVRDGIKVRFLLHDKENIKEAQMVTPTLEEVFLQLFT